MTIDYRYLRSHLQKLLDDSISEPELTGLVQLCRSICQSHLEHSRPSVVLLAVRQGLAIVDVAYDCIAEAFARDDKGAFTQLENFAESLRGSLVDLPDHEIFLAFKGFLIRIADAQLARLYAQADPAGSRIHRNIRDCLKHSTHQVWFSLDKDFRGYVLRPLQSDSLDHLPPFAPDELEQEFLSNARKHHRIPELLHIFHEIVTRQSKYRRSPLLDRIDLHIEVPAVKYKELSSKESGEKSEATRTRVIKAGGGTGQTLQGKKGLVCKRGHAIKGDPRVLQAR